MAMFSSFNYGSKARNAAKLEGTVNGALQCISKAYYYNSSWFWNLLCLCCGATCAKSAKAFRKGKCTTCGATTAPAEKVAS
jgi:hypothetical protein